VLSGWIWRCQSQLKKCRVGGEKDQCCPSTWARSFHERMVRSQSWLKRENQNSYPQTLASASTSNPFQTQCHAFLGITQPSIYILGIQSLEYGWSLLHKGNNKSDFRKKPEEISTIDKKLLEAKPRFPCQLACWIIDQIFIKRIWIILKWDVGTYTWFEITNRLKFVLNNYSATVTESLLPTLNSFH